MRPVSLIFTFAFLSFSACTGYASEVVFASLNNNVRKQVDRFTRLEVYLEKELEDIGVTDVRLEVFQDPKLLSQSLESGRADFYFDSPLVAAKIGAPAGAEMFLRRWKRGVGKYHSVIFVKSDSGLQSLDDLRGKRIAMQDPASTSGYLLPVSILSGYSLPLAEIKSREDMPAEDAVGYIFTGDDKNTALWVAKGFVEAGATDNVTFAQLEKVAPGQYRSLARSSDLPRQVLLKRKGLDPVVAQRVADVLTSMHRTEEGRRILLKFNKTTKFERFQEGPEETMAPLLEILDTLAGADMNGW
ncbi:phosphate/phosphite/phosphonate ABC transporter substrate-binding protein [Cribrihabitans neustonicus]|uniref:phosphate/phosphite/phosphonate ABC transporter substrate-binding protein n=1 Tax=Cribrihabitans neustonicus TaxID=1429085 RepID=UPI003B59962B